MQFEIAYLKHNPEVFEKHLEPSLKNLSGDFITTAISNGNKPAKAYNKVLRESKCDFIILTHEDMSFSSNMLERVEFTINEIPDFGVLGVVGKSKSGEYCWANRNKSSVVSTLDCCFVVIRRADGLYFDEVAFDNFHLYVEDYCMMVKEKYGRLSRTLLMNFKKEGECPDYLRHYSHTIKARGPCWGRYAEYRDKLLKRYPEVKIT